MADQPEIASPALPEQTVTTTSSLFDGLTTTTAEEPQPQEVAPTASSSALDTLFKLWKSSVSEVEIAQYSDGPSEKYRARVDEKDSNSNNATAESASTAQPASEGQTDSSSPAPVSATGSSIFNFSFWTSSASEETEKPAENATSNNANDATKQPSAADADALAKKKQLEAIPLDKFRISNDDVEYLKEHLTPTNMRLEVVPRWDGTGAQYTPLGWAIYTNARESITFFLTNKIAPIDPTSVVARSYMTILPDMLMKSAFVRRMAPSQIYEKTQYSCNALDLAVMLGRKEVLEEILNLAIAWNRKFHDPLGYALDLSKTFLGWTSGKLPFEEKDTPRKVTVSAEESKTYQAMIDILVQAGGGEIADDVWENSHWLLTVDTPSAEFTGSITEFKIPSNNTSNAVTPISSSSQLSTSPPTQSTAVPTASTTNNSNSSSATTILPSLLDATAPVQSTSPIPNSSNLLFQSSSPLATSPSPTFANIPTTSNPLFQSSSPLASSPSPISVVPTTASNLLFQASSPLATSPAPISLPLDLNFASSPIPFSSALSPTGPLSPVMSPRLANDPNLLFPLSPRSQNMASSPSVMELLNSPRTMPVPTEPVSSLIQSISPTSTSSLLDANLSPRRVASNEVQLF